MRSSNRSRLVDTEHNDDALLSALKVGDERVFCDLVQRWSGIMLRLALSHVESRAIAEEVVSGRGPAYTEIMLAVGDVRDGNAPTGRRGRGRHAP